MGLTLTTLTPPTVEVVVRADGIEVARTTGQAGEPLVLALPGARRWSPEDPYLYDLEVRSGTDVVRSYAGMRLVRARARCRRATSPAAQR